MPIHDLGYRNWDGHRGSNLLRWWVIAHTGIRLAWKKPWLRRMLFFASFPVLGFAALFFVYEQARGQSPAAVQFLAELFQVWGGGGGVGNGGEFQELVRELRFNPDAARHLVWSTLLMILFRSPQALIMVLMIGLIAPTLIANDMRSRAFLLYFSRPITPIEYVLGKSLIVWTYILMITCLPALLLYGMAVLLSPDFGVIALTWDLPLRILVASAVLAIPTTAVALCFSSMTTESRYAAFGWFAMWALGYVTYAMLSGRDAIENLSRQPTQKVPMDRWTLFSPYATLGEVQTWIFGLKSGGFAEVLPEAVAILAITVVSLLVLVRRVSAPMRI